MVAPTIFLSHISILHFSFPFSCSPFLSIPHSRSILSHSCHILHIPFILSLFNIFLLSPSFPLLISIILFLIFLFFRLVPFSTVFRRPSFSLHYISFLSIPINTIFLRSSPFLFFCSSLSFLWFISPSFQLRVVLFCIVFSSACATSRLQVHISPTLCHLSTAMHPSTISPAS